MEISRLNDYCTVTSSKKAGTKCKSDTESNMDEVFNNEVANWKEKIKVKISEDLQNDSQKNIKMSEKQWHALIDKVDNAINIHKLDVKKDTNVDQSKPNDKEKE